MPKGVQRREKYFPKKGCICGKWKKNPTTISGNKTEEFEEDKEKGTQTAKKHAWESP